ncbi:exodeoxyribonuclease VII small subunit [Ponticaulis sp.]|uniref:exodeoxyribonuclease VII small subunit n=1 Tax=Ponticaulis sp. TaxID=2020902 RepID=UPI000C6182C5|nr:exodeoxyribonuclease VII small subunit [Ponticaulis sp.]MAJ08335.1 exodeoxyribonuclease VII small subunit [Ponticaulis sp.]MDF1681575.1 exodeoxyribonuclease VII small subunit [Ponticaulis sp.]HBH90248.1 exodeoxyribonuclease VII small subunit [Hyphomonadaceae bacterium]|tara:strand:- start:81073 stop:81318 length:246 start_codon:yes stop_codon:yes gene_type:complete
MGDQTSVENLSFEDALKELETIVEKLEGGDVELEESIKIYERGAALKAHCLGKLKNAQLKVEQIVLNQDGDVSAAPVSADS